MKRSTHSAGHIPLCGNFLIGFIKLDLKRQTQVYRLVGGQPDYWFQRNRGGFLIEDDDCPRSPLALKLSLDNLIKCYMNNITFFLHIFGKPVLVVEKNLTDPLQKHKKCTFNFGGYLCL